MMEGSRVVVVEDEPEMLDIMQVNLEQAGYHVVPARDGVEACRLLDTANCDAVVLDLELPRLSGFRLATLLRRDPRWRGVPVVVVTASHFEEVEEIADKGVQGFITKPFDPADLVSQLKYVLSRAGRMQAYE
ncbi:MAG: response regulator [Chloroflexi bacterium]|nr:response regulator [Chloroflexota bacterium]